MTKTSNFKYNKNKYYWFIDGHIFIPDVEWEAVRIQAIFEDDFSSQLCHIGDKNICILEQDRELTIPENLFSEIENFVRQELAVVMQIPSDGADDNQNVMR